jgi:hypothetical protein
MASQPRMKTKAKWREELDKLCECVQSDRREPSQQCQPLDVQSRLNLDEERNLYSDAQLGALRLTNIQWLEFVKKMYNHWYYTSDQRDELISIFVRYDPDNDGLTQLDNFRWVMTTAGEGEELDEEVQREHVNYEGYRTPYSSEAVGSKLLKQAPHSILGKNPSNNTQNMLRFAVNVNLTWPVQVIHQFCEEEGLQSNQRHAQFKDDLSRALREEVQDHTVLDVAVGKGNFQVVETLVKLLLLCNVDQSTRARPLHNAITDGFDDIAYYLVTSFPNMIKEIVKGQSVLETVGQSKRLADKTKLEDFLLKKIYHVEGEPILVKRLLHGPLGMTSVRFLQFARFD